MKELNAKTGYGYFTDANGTVVAKATLKPGRHPLKEGFEYIEVNDQAALDEIEVYKEPESEESKLERLIQQETRSLAIESLKRKKLWPEGE